MNPIRFKIQNTFSEIDSNIEQDRLKLESHLDDFKTIQSKLEGSEVSGARYGGLLLLNNLILCLDALNQSYIHNNYLATLSLNRHFSELFMDIRVTVEDLTTGSAYGQERINHNLENYAGLILWKEKRLHDDISKEKSLNGDEPLEGEIINSSKTMMLYHQSIIKQLGLSNVVEQIENRKQRRIPTYRDLLIRGDKKHPNFKELHYPWSKIEYKRATMFGHAEYNSLFISEGKCISGNENINLDPLLIKPQLSKIEAIELWISIIYRTLWPEIAWGKLYSRVNLDLKE